MDKNEENYIRKHSMQVINNRISIKKGTSFLDHKKFRRLPSHFDEERAIYQAKLLFDEEEEIQGQQMFKRKKINIIQFFFHFFEPIDYLYFALGMIGSIACGISDPLLTYINSNVYTDVGNSSENNGSLSEKELMHLKVKDTMESNIKKQLIYGSISFVGNIVAYFFIGLNSTRALYNLKKKYFTLILSQEQGWFDSTNTYEFATKIQAQIEYIEIGFGEMLVLTINSFFTGIAAFIFAFLGTWKLALVLSSFVPIMIVITVIISKKNFRGNTLVKETWEKAGGIAEEIFYNIKTVASFCNFEYELKRFYEQVEISNKIELRANYIVRFLVPFLNCVKNLVVFVAFVYGRTLVKKEFNSFRGRDVSGGDVVLTFNAMSSFVQAVADISNDIQFIIYSLIATSDYFNLYERKIQIDLTNSTKKPPLSEIRGDIEYRNVKFYYPSDINKKMIINGINLNIESGKKIALIGHSGCGKSTLVNLLERLYEVVEGEILLDGIDIRKYDIQYLRRIIGYVEQEPVLFNRSIRENIIFGREEYLKESGEDVNLLIKNACEDAYVTEFVDNVPGGLNYVVGLKGSKLSGGQKQRIAIARAILIKPKILILDEATSALDNKSEKFVQIALDNISKKNITTIIIAHRLSTIKNADLIYALKGGQVIEQGTHEELLAKGGYYAEMIKPQLMQKELDDEFQKEEIIRQKTSIRRVNTDEEVHFENKINELAVAPEDVVIDPTKIIKELWTRYKLETIFGTIAIILLGVSTPVQGYFNGRGVNGLNSKYQTVIYDKSLKYGIIYLIVGLFNNFIHYIAFTAYFNYGINLAKIYRNKMMKKYLSFHLAYFDLDRYSPGSLLSKMSIDTMQLRVFSKRIIGNLITSLAIILTSLIVGCCHEWRLTLIVVAFMPFMIVITFIRRLTMQVDSPKSIESSMDGGRIISECVTNSKTIFAYNFSREAIRLYLLAIDYITQQQNRDNFINGVVIGLEIFSRYSCYSAVYGATKRFVLNDTLTTDEMSVILSIAGVGFNSLTTLMRDIGHIRKAVAAVRSIYSTLETQSLISPFLEDNIHKTPANNITGKIEFKHVYFAYPTYPNNVILKDVSFEILPGQKVALVGYSGCGKSSIIQLLNRFYDVEDGKGEILIDGINIKDYNLYELRKKIGFVSQEPSVFKGPSIENVRYGNLNATDDECFQAASEANALNILEREKNINIDNNIKKKKNALSGGEKQKLAIARMFLKNPKILLLDEPTSALDKESEIEIEKSLDRLSMNKTTISIAHRLNTIENYDKIIVLDKGRLYEQGTHEELMKLHKRYFTLHKFSS